MDLDSIEFVAEKIFEYEREHCQGDFGGGEMSSTGCRTFFYCQWCACRYEDNDVLRRPCPNYPFPKFSMRELMQKLGNMGIEITLRYDSHRAENNFTLMTPKFRICDTDEPLRALCDWLLENGLSKSD